MDDLELLLTERACERLIFDYAARVDFGRASTVADLFCEDGTWTGVDLELRGRAAIHAWFAEREVLERRVSRHVHTNVLVEVQSPTEARALSYMLDYRCDSRDGRAPTLPVAGDVPKYQGECHDLFRLTPEGWRFAARRVTVAFVRRSPSTER